MNRYFCRLCLNTAHWECPTGNAGQREGNTHSGHYGFAFEEFNFDFQLCFEGWQYGWIEGFFTPPKQFRSFVPYGIHDVIFYTLGENGRYFVGRIRECEHISQQERPDVYPAGIVHRLINRANVAGADIRQTNTNSWQYFPVRRGSHKPIREFKMVPNIRFNPTHSELWDDQMIALISYNRYGPLVVDGEPQREQIWTDVVTNHP